MSAGGNTPLGDLPATPTAPRQPAESSPETDSAKDDTGPSWGSQVSEDAVLPILSLAGTATAVSLSGTHLLGVESRAHSHSQTFAKHVFELQMGIQANDICSDSSMGICEHCIASSFQDGSPPRLLWDKIWRSLKPTKVVGHFKIVLALHTMMGSYKDNFAAKRMDDNMHAFAWSTGVNAVTNQLQFNTLFELAASVASEMAHLPTPKLFEPLTDRAKFKFVISKLPKVSARYRTCFEEDVDKCLNLDDMFKFFAFQEGRTGSMASGAKGGGMLSNLNVEATPSRFDITYDGESVELAILQRQNVHNNTWIQ